MSQNTKSVYLAIPNTGELRMELAQTITQLTHQDKYDLVVRYPVNKPITYNRNMIVQNFLESGCDYLMMCDTDIVPPLSILNLVDFDKDIISPVCFTITGGYINPLVLKRNFEEQYNVIDLDDEAGLIECDALGTGCIIIKREVLADPRWKTTEGAWFKNEYDNNGKKTEGNDLAFCKRAKAMGYKIFCHTDYFCSHFVETDLKQIYSNLIKSDEYIKQVKIN
jgi:hypothetical protein